jgi:hypothetical protein
MKKGLLFASFLFFISLSVFAQSWTVRVKSGGETWDFDVVYTVITKAQFERQLKQHTAREECAIVEFTGILDMKPKEEIIINGMEPVFKGNYYLLATTIALTEEGKKLLNSAGMKTSLIYGNPKTGELKIIFTNMQGMLAMPAKAYILGSEKFEIFYNVCLGLVDGE